MDATVDRDRRAANGSPRAGSGADHQLPDPRSGKLLVLLDPPENVKEPAPMPRLTGLLNEWGIKATEYRGRRRERAHIEPDRARSRRHRIRRTRSRSTSASSRCFRWCDICSRRRRRRSGPARPSCRRGAQLGGNVAGVAGRSEEPASRADPAKGDVTGPVSIGVATSVPAATPDRPRPPTRRTADEGAEAGNARGGHR